MLVIEAQKKLDDCLSTNYPFEKFLEYFYHLDQNSRFVALYEFVYKIGDKYVSGDLNATYDESVCNNRYMKFEDGIIKYPF
jgi:hypothetical protein